METIAFDRLVAQAKLVIICQKNDPSDEKDKKRFAKAHRAFRRFFLVEESWKKYFHEAERQSFVRGGLAEL